VPIEGVDIAVSAKVRGWPGVEASGVTRSCYQLLVLKLAQELLLM
jgi:hypothetical protein